MIKIIIVGVSITLLSACVGTKAGKSKNIKEAHTKPIQSSPEGTMNIMFEAAKTGDYSLLKNLCHPDIDNDGDTKRVCDCEGAQENEKEDYKKYFAEGAVVKSIINGSEAQVEFTFGMEGKMEETMHLKKKEGKWYLYSF